MAAPRVPTLRLPVDWPAVTRSGVLHAVALARLALVSVRGWGADSRLARVRLAAENDRLRSEVALLREELRIRDARLGRIPARHRPHHPPHERLAILTLRATRGWSAEQTALRFLVTAVTIGHWMQRLDEAGEGALVRVPVPVNRFPDFARDLVARLRATCPLTGTQRIADVLARAGLHLARATVRRVLREPRPLPERPVPAPTNARAASRRTVTARYSGHVWNVDLTVMPTAFGFWVPWVPQAWAQCRPFAWKIGVVIDHFSRRVVGTACWKTEPSAAEVIAMLETTVLASGRTPKHLVSDQGSQFREEYRTWCNERGVRPRFGAVGRHGSIALVERFIRSLKAEGLRSLIAIPLCTVAMAEDLAIFVEWYDEHRPHRGLGGATPNEIYFGRPRARDAPRFEVWGRYPTHDVELRAEAGSVVELCVERYRGRAHLLVIETRPAA